MIALSKNDIQSLENRKTYNDYYSENNSILLKYNAVENAIVKNSPVKLELGDFKRELDRDILSLENISFMKLIFIYLAKTTPLKQYIESLENYGLDNEALENPITINQVQLEALLITENTIIDYMLKTIEDEAPKTYTTGELAKHHEVSVQAVNNWIAEGRYVGFIKPEKYKQARIPDNTFWVSNSGEQVLIRDVVVAWGNNHLKSLKNADIIKEPIKQEQEEPLQVENLKSAKWNTVFERLNSI